MTTPFHESRPRTPKPRRHGSTLVEMAFVLPLIMFFFAMMFELCRVLMLQHTADTAAYEAARAAMVPGATAAEAQQVAQQMINSNGLKQTSVLVSPEILTETTPLITVKVNIPVNENSWIAPSQLGNFVVSSEVTLLCERPPIIRLSAMSNLSAQKDKLKNDKTSL